ncbi:MAG: flagellar biosynthesis anti-sigma factor FlgM [Thermodesulfovibrionales bacterium]
MKIHGERPVDPQVSGKNVKKVSEEKAISIKRNSSVQSLRKDRVDISERAKEAARLIEAIKAIPDIRTEKVDEIREAISSGKYRIEPMKIAEKILGI